MNRNSKIRVYEHACIHKLLPLNKRTNICMYVSCMMGNYDKHCSIAI